MRHAWLVVIVLAGCADVRMPNAIERAQFAWIARAVDEQTAERTPASDVEAKRLTEMKLVALDGVELTKLEVRHKGRPDRVVPSPTDHDAVRGETERFAEDVEADLAWQAMLEPFRSQWGFGMTDAVSGGGMGILSVAVGLLMRKLRQKNRALDEKKRKR